MSDVSRLRVLRVGIHSSAYDYTATPSTLVPLRPTDDVDSFLPRNRAPIARPLRSRTGRRYEHIRGAQTVDDLTLPLEFRGVASNTGAAVTDWEAKMEQGLLLQSIFGAVAPATTGDAPEVAAAGHTPASGILEVVGTTAANGHVVAFPTSAGLQVGRVLSGGGTTTLTLQHPYEGTPTTGADVIRLAVHTVDDDLTAHTHCYFDAEGQNWRRTYAGCMPMGCEIVCTPGQALAFTSTWGPTSYASPATASPAHAEPTAGNPIVADKLKMLLDNNEILLAGPVTIRVDPATKPRPTMSKVNGRFGGVSAMGDGKLFQIEFGVFIGDNAGSFDELVDASGSPTLQALLGDGDSAGDISATREVALQIGTEIGAVAYALIPTADMVVTTETMDGYTIARCVATGTGALPGILAIG